MKKLKISSLFILSAFLFSCEDSIDKDNLPIPYPEIGGYENSDEIAPGDLVAKFSFEDNLIDAKNNVTGAVPNNVAYAVGAKGKAYDGSATQLRYAVANANTAITGLNNFTISFWMKSSNTVAPTTPGQGKGAQGIFTIVRPTEFWGGINVFIENPDAAFPDRIRLKLGVENGRSAVVWRGQSVIMNIDGQKGKWIHVTMAYDSTTSKVSCYLNGEPASNLNGFAYAPATGLIGSALWFADDPGSIDNTKNAPGYGVFQMVGTNGKIVIGNHQFETVPSQNGGGQEDWATSFAGQLDEFRLYKTALKANEVLSLYQLEKNNR